MPQERLEDISIGSVLLVLVVVFTILTPTGTFLTFDNLQSVFLNASTLMVLSAGVTVLLIAGGLDLSIGSVAVFSSVVTAKVVGSMSNAEAAISTGNYEHLGLAIAVGVVVALLSGMVWGAINGLIIVKLGIPSFIATLATLGIALGLAQVLADGVNVANVPIPLQEGFGLGEAFGFLPWPVVVAAAVTALLWVVLSKTRFGLRNYAIGSNAESARRAGINVDRHMFVLYVMVGVLAGTVAMIDISRFGVASLSAHSQDALAAIAACVIGGTSLFGGRGRMFGTIIGVFIPAVLLNGFVIMQIDPFWQNVAVGIVLLSAVYVDQLRRKKSTSY
jgi:ribose transport system permease protein